MLLSMVDMTKCLGHTPNSLLMWCVRGRAHQAQHVLPGGNDTLSQNTLTSIMTSVTSVSISFIRRRNLHEWENISFAIRFCRVDKYEYEICRYTVCPPAIPQSSYYSCWDLWRHGMAVSLAHSQACYNGRHNFVNSLGHKVNRLFCSRSSHQIIQYLWSSIPQCTYMSACKQQHLAPVTQPVC